jgi:hypothetical protein
VILATSSSPSIRLICCLPAKSRASCVNLPEVTSKTVLINAGKPLEGAKGTYPPEKIDRRRVEEELVKFVAGVVAG